MANGIKECDGEKANKYGKTEATITDSGKII